MKIKCIIFLFFLLPSFVLLGEEQAAKAAKLDFGKIIVPDPGILLANKLKISGKLKFKDGWLEKLLGKDYDKKIQLMIYVEGSEIGAANIKPTGNQHMKWELEITLQNLSKSILVNLGKGNVDLKLFHGNQVLIE